MNTDSITPNHRILIVDDNPAIHDDFRKILCPAGPDQSELDSLKAALFDEAPKVSKAARFELVSAFQGQEALAKMEQSLAEERPFAMAFLDVRMPPGWDGIETAARLWAVCPELQIVICTAYSDYSWDEMRARLDQPDSLVILKKPFDNVEVQQLAHAMTRKWLVSRQARLQLAQLEHMVEDRTADLRRTGESLRVSEERFNKAFHNSPMPSAILSLPDQRFVAANDGLLKLMGLSPDELLGSSALERGLWENPGDATGWFTHLAAQQDVRDQETKIRTGSGAVREALVSLGPVTLGGEPHALLVLQDVSERLHMEKQLRQSQKMEAIGTLAAGISHDFNNLIAIIMGHAELIRMRGSLPPASGPALEKVLAASRRAAELVKQIQQFSREEKIEFVPLDLGQLLTETHSLLKGTLPSTIDLRLELNVARAVVQGHASQLQQVLINLATNARDALPNQTGLLAFRLEPTPGDVHHVRLSVTDTGCGMDPATLGRMFDPFFTTKPVGQGTGLGLAVAHGILKAHKVFFQVESEPGRGTSFLFDFLLADVPVAKARLAVPEPEAGLSVGGHILLVDDEPVLRESVRMILESQGYSITEAGSGREAFDLLQPGRPRFDLLLTDKAMPDMDGLELIRRTHALAPELPVILTSGLLGEAEENLCAHGMIHALLPKPVEMKHLLRMIFQLLAARQTPDENSPRPSLAHQPEPCFA
jgi:two-component system, cell cycle sensor histidine kinase and response regulator CckA